MPQFHLAWIELTVGIPLLGAIIVGRIRDPQRAQRTSLWFHALTLAAALAAWIDHGALGPLPAHAVSMMGLWLPGRDLLVVDALNAPLFSLVAVLNLATSVATMRTKVQRFSFSAALASEALLLATFGCRDPWVLIVLLLIGIVPPWWELQRRGRSTRIYLLHMLMFALLLVAGGAMVSTETVAAEYRTGGAVFLVAAVLLRSGIVPVHCWMTDLVENLSFGTALLFVTPMTGVYAALRLVVPVAPAWALGCVTILSLTTAVYAAAMALVQREARRFFCYLLLSHSSLVLVGLEIATPIGLTGALSLWLSASLSLAGFGLTLRALEARMGRLSLSEHLGLYEHMPTLAAFFLLTGLASVGYPGTIGFLATELLVEGAVQAFPYIGVAVVAAGALNGIAVVQAYFRLFGGARYSASVSLRSRPSERVAVLALGLLILGGGLLPQPGIKSRYRAAIELVRLRAASVAAPLQAERPHGLH